MLCSVCCPGFGCPIKLFLFLDSTEAFGTEGKLTISIKFTKEKKRKGGVGKKCREGKGGRKGRKMTKRWKLSHTKKAKNARHTKHDHSTADKQSQHGEAEAGTAGNCNRAHAA